MRFTFVHAADLHLDSPLTAAVQAEPRLQSILERATFKAFERVVELCLERRALFLLLAGDLFEVKDRSVSARLFLREQLQRLHVAGVQVFIVHGNHDPLSGDRGTVSLPDSVKVFGSDWEEALVLRDGQLVCRVQGISYPTERVEENLSRRFERRGGEFTIGLLHANVGGQSTHANYAPASWEDLSDTRLDYWALGHVHTRSEQRLASGGWAIYPGNPQGRHAREIGPRGCMVVEVEDGSCQPAFVPVDVVRWHLIPIRTELLSDLGLLEAEIEEAVSDACQTEHAAHVVRLVLQGRTTLHRELAESEAREGWVARLRETLQHRSSAVVLERLINETQPTVDLQALRAEGGLGAAVLEQAEQVDVQTLLRDAPLRSLEDALARSGAGSLGVGPGSLATLVERAARRAVELLMEES